MMTNMLTTFKKTLRRYVKARSHERLVVRLIGRHNISQPVGRIVSYCFQETMRPVGWATSYRPINRTANCSCERALINCYVSFLLQLSAMSTISFHWFCLLLCLSMRGVTAQPTTDWCSRDDDCNRQMAIMEQTLTILQSVDRRLLSVEKRMEEKTTDGGADHENGKGLRRRG